MTESLRRDPGAAAKGDAVRKVQVLQAMCEQMLQQRGGALARGEVVIPSPDDVLKMAAHEYGIDVKSLKRAIRRYEATSARTAKRVRRLRRLKQT